jgi:hypothetical protein
VSRGNEICDEDVGTGQFSGASLLMTETQISTAATKIWKGRVEGESESMG